MPLRLAIAGFGPRGERHANVARVCKSVQLVGICDPDPARASIIPRNLRVDGNVEDLIRERQPEAMILSLPHDAYYERMDLCGRNGIHLLKEKPVARSFLEAHELAARTSEWSNVIVVAVQRRHSSTADRMRVHRKHDPPLAAQTRSTNSSYRVYCCGRIARSATVDARQRDVRVAEILGRVLAAWRWGEEVGGD